MLLYITCLLFVVVVYYVCILLVYLVVCLFVCLFSTVFVWLSVCLSVYLSVCVSICLSFRTVCLSAILFVFISIQFLLPELRECSSHLEKDFVGYVSFPQPPRSKRNTHQQHIRRQHTEPFQTGQAHPPFTPNIPKSGNSRPNSAQKLRQMILETRETV